ncbi:MAG TPA: GTPase [Lacipirellulaceae bacterium]|nr:GTPase [Lacipirellulaceae bacterium]
MPYDTHDTIVAIATAAGPGGRGVVRVSGAGVSACLARCFRPARAEELAVAAKLGIPRRIPGAIRLAGTGGHGVPGALFYWPGTRSFTREPSAEFHAIGSPPLLAAVLEELCRCGARPAEPGEFTLRAFIGGRIDLTQAEAVLGVVDARTPADLDAALAQLAGGLSTPLDALREQLLVLLAEVEAALDFADERLETIAPAELERQLKRASDAVAAAVLQLQTRTVRTEPPRVLLTGAPNAGKSRLFNALVERCSAGATLRSIVSPVAGATRDFVVAPIVVQGLACELIDAAGDDASAAGAIAQAAQRATGAQRRQADLELHCVDCRASAPPSGHPAGQASGEVVVVRTKSDLLAAGETPPVLPPQLACSAATAAGLDELEAAIATRLASAASGSALGGGATARCLGALAAAAAALGSAAQLARSDNPELLAAELRHAINAVGEVVGAVCADDVLDRVFSQFCIGK